MTEDERVAFIEQLRALQNDHDPEANHVEADGILMEVLRKLGENEIVDAYDAIAPKWYA